MAYAEKIESFGDTNWYLVDRKPYKCPTCNSTKTIAKAVLGYPTEDDWFDISDTSIDQTNLDGSTLAFHANFTGNFVWVRAKISGMSAGAISKILYNN